MLYIFQNFACTLHFLRFYVLYIFLLIKKPRSVFVDLEKDQGQTLFKNFCYAVLFQAARWREVGSPLLVYNFDRPCNSSYLQQQSQQYLLKREKFARREQFQLRLRMSSQLSFAKECLYFYSSTVSLTVVYLLYLALLNGILTSRDP